MASKKIGDPMAKLPKETLLTMYRTCARERDWYERLEVLRTRGVKPVASLSVDVAENATEAQMVSAQVFAPNAADGGVIRVLWQTETSWHVEVTGYETWISQNQKNMHACIAVRTLAERLVTAVYHLRHPEIAAANKLSREALVDAGREASEFHAEA